MACDRIEGVLQVVFHTQKTLGFSKEPTCDGERIPPYYQNTDGEVEGMSFPARYLPYYLTPCGRPMTGERCLVCIIFLFPCLYSIFWTETMTEHRTKTLSSLLPIALATGYTEVELGSEPLKVLLLGNLNHKLADIFHLEL